MGRKLSTAQKLEVGRMLREGVSDEGIRVAIDARYAWYIEWGLPPVDESKIVEGSLVMSKEQKPPSGASPTKERDTHFKGTAKILYEVFIQLQRDDEHSINEMLAPNYPDKWRVTVERRIAQFLYDFMYQTRLKTCYGMDLLDIERWIAEDVPDFTEWSEEEKGR